MKDDIHPKYHPVVFVDPSVGAEFVTRSTMTSNETREIDGVKHYVVRMEISSASHPFYTGKRKFVDSTGRVEKFREKYNYKDAGAE
ncbi:MAG: type B 50S ribosomal protein L31 [Candidatus Krumholzibacteria bacterium]|nr:type B 50S ribosomal protein L31 [Candidatus Krumholzibacteria bacterium]